MLLMNSLHQIFLQCGKVETDTRSIEPGSMFFALKGDNFDANEMVGDALAKGAGHVVTSNRFFEGDPRVTCVPDPLANASATCSLSSIDF
jgi:UDP-N-acetylmuramyl pentapeptide synthase